MPGSVQVETHPYTWTEGDRRPVLNGFINNNDVAVDITAYTIAAKLRQPDNTIVTLTVVITTPLSGLFEIRWAAGDLLEGRGQLMEIEINDGSGEIETKRLLINVAENMG